MAEGCSDAVLAAWQRAAGRSSSVARTAGVRRGCCLHGSLDARRNGSCHALMAVVCLQPAPPPPPHRGGGTPCLSTATTIAVPAEEKWLSRGGLCMEVWAGRCNCDGGLLAANRPVLQPCSHHPHA